MRGTEPEKCVAECHKRIAEKHGIVALPSDERYQQLARVALADLAAVDRQLIRNIARSMDQDVWRLHENEAVSVEMRVNFLCFILPELCTAYVFRSLKLGEAPSRTCLPAVVPRWRQWQVPSDFRS